MCHTDFMNDTLLKSYNRSFNGGKSRFARICDNVFSALLLTAALYLLVSRKLHHGAASLFAAMLISASILLTASLLRSLRFNAHIKKLRRETSESILRRRLSKVVLSVTMIAGRLELFPILVLFSREAWRHI